MTSRFQQHPALVALLLFLVASLLSFHLTATYFAVSLDEGIYLNGGQRIASGESLYVDFFAFIGPVLYWIQSALYSLFGNHLPSLRWSTALSVGIIVASLYLLGRHLAGTTCGLLGSLLWLGVWLDLPNRMEVNHRWVSMAWYSLAMAILLTAPPHSRRFNALAGLLIAIAALTTPSFIVSALILATYLFFLDRSRLVSFISGGLLGATIVIAVLASKGQLWPFLDGIRWAAENYAEANRFPYGRFPSDVPKKYFLQIYMGAIVIPASLIAATAFAWWRREPRILAPIIYCLALFAATYPKWDAYSLHFVSGPFFMLLFAVLYLVIPDPLKNLAEGLALVLFAYLTLSAWMLPDRLTQIPTRAGNMMGNEVNVQVIEALEKAIPAKSTLLVYPYLTGLYALLDSRLVTRYDFLQPGMMTARDEQIVLDDVAKNPPQFVFWQNFPDEDVLLIWPNSRPSKHRFTQLENWIRANYTPGVVIPVSNIRGQVWERKQSSR